MSDKKANSAVDFDPVTAEVIRMGLEAAAEEMASVMTRTSGSPSITEAQDFSTGILDAKGEHIAYSGYVTLHMAASAIGVKSLLEHVPLEEMQPGDAWLGNDPFITGAMHAPDWGLVMPIFAEGSVIGFAWSEAHLLDTGGVAPGGFGVGAHDCYGENLRLPHVKFLEGGKTVEAVAQIIANNVRLPTLVLNDIRSFVAANNTCAQRVAELVDRYDLETFQFYCEVLKDLSERQLRERIRKIPNGSWSSEDWQEDNGHVEDLFRQEARLEVNDDSLHLDFTGDPQTDGSINGHYGSTLGSALTSLSQTLFWDIPYNAGILRCLEIEAESGTVVNATPPAPVAVAHMDSGMTVTKLTTELISKALAASGDEDLRKRGSGQFQDSWSLNFWTGTDQYGEVSLFINMDGGGGGGGAQAVIDGMDVGSAMCQPNNSFPDIEMNEQLYGILFLWRELYQDSGGPGRFRGGMGMRGAWIPWDTEGYTGLTNTACSHVPPRGAMGGYPASTCGFWLKRNDVESEFFARGRVPEYGDLKDDAERLRMKRIGIPASRSGKEVFFYSIGGGGGYGDPLLRPAEVVAEDVRDGYVSVRQAHGAYGVVVAADGRLDEEASRARREDIRRQRLGESDPLAPDSQRAEANVEGSIHEYLIAAPDGSVSCVLCESRLSDDADWQAGAVTRTTPLFERLDEMGVEVRQHPDAELGLVEHFCPGCATTLEATVARTDETGVEAAAEARRAEPVASGS